MGNIALLLIAANDRMIDDWRTQALKLWSIRIALFWGAVSGLVAAWPALAGSIPVWAYASVSVLLSAAVVGSRLTKQMAPEDQ